MEKQNDQSKFIIQRLDNYVSGTNVKGSFLLAFNTFFIGIIITNYSKIHEFIIPDKSSILNTIFYLLIVVSLFTTFFTIRTVYPFLNSGNSSKDRYHSHIFFMSIAEFKDCSAYHQSFSELSEKEFSHDLSYQAFELSKGLTRKYNYLKWAMRAVYIELFCLLGILILVLIF